MYDDIKKNLTMISRKADDYKTVAKMLAGKVDGDKIIGDVKGNILRELLSTYETYGVVQASTYLSFGNGDILYNIRERTLSVLDPEGNIKLVTLHLLEDFLRDLTKTVENVTTLTFLTSTSVTGSVSEALKSLGVD